jgi:hypothetical protein
MANTITTTVKVVWANGDGDTITGQVAQRVTQTGNAVYSNIQTVGTPSETVTVGEVSGDCYQFFKNNTAEWSELTAAEQAAYDSESDYNTQNSVYVGTTNPATSSSANTFKLKPGAGALKDGALETHYAIRDTHNVDLLVMIFEK